MDCRRRSAVDDDRSQRIRLAVDDDRRRGRWAVDDNRSRITFYQAQVNESLDRIDRRLRRIKKMQSSATITTSSSSLQLPLQWRDPPPDRTVRNHPVAVFSDYPPLELLLRWRDPPPLQCQIRVPEPPSSSIATTADDSNHRSYCDPRACTRLSSPERPAPASASRVHSGLVPIPFQPSLVTPDSASAFSCELISLPQASPEPIGPLPLNRPPPPPQMSALKSSPDIPAQPPPCASNPQTQSSRSDSPANTELPPLQHKARRQSQPNIGIQLESALDTPNPAPMRDMCTISATLHSRHYTTAAMLMLNRQRSRQKMEEIHKGNVALLKKVSPEEIEGAEKEVIKQMDPVIVEMFGSRADIAPGVQMFAVNSTDKANPLQRSQVVRFNVNEGSDPKFVGPGDKPIGTPVITQIQANGANEDDEIQGKIQQTVNQLVAVPASLVAYVEDTKERARDDTLLYITRDEILHPDKLFVWRKNGDFTNQQSGMCENEVDDTFVDLVANNGKLGRQYEAIEVDWYPLGDEAFEKARRRAVPIFLSIGYSTCYWCHVMEVESFENDEIARRLNEWFVSIKVDREERPDVDKYI